MVGVAGIEVAVRARMRSNRRPARVHLARAVAKLAARAVAKLAARAVARVAGTIAGTIDVAAAVVGPTSGETTAARRR
jgi:hypothetical protein